MSPGSGVDGSLSLTDVFRMSDYTRDPGEANLQDKFLNRRGYRIHSISIHNDPFKFDPGLAKVNLSQKYGIQGNDYGLLLIENNGQFDYGWDSQGTPYWTNVGPGQVAKHAAMILDEYYGIPMGRYLPSGDLIMAQRD